MIEIHGFKYFDLFPQSTYRRKGMSDRQAPDNVKELLTRIDHVSAHEEQVAVNDILDVVGHRSFGTMSLVIGLIMAAPVIGDIPGGPSLCLGWR